MNIQKIFSKYSLIFILSLTIIAVLALTAYVYFGDTGALTRELAGLRKREASLKATAMDKTELEDRLKAAQDKLAEFELVFPSEIYEGDALRTVKDFEDKSGLTVNAMNFELIPLQDDSLNQPPLIPPGTAPSAAAARAPVSLDPIPGRGMKIPINTQFSAVYPELKEFVTQINETRQRIGLREIRMTTGRDQIIKGSVIMEFYGFMPEID